MTEIACLRLDSPVGMLRVCASDQGICGLDIFPEPGIYRAMAEERPRPLLEDAARQLRDYFAGQGRGFDLPIDTAGTPFQEAAWRLMRAIPHGETKTYGELAALLGNRAKARAVGGAANRNPVAILTPCHRVLGAGGALIGFSSGLEVKRLLLELEARNERLRGNSQHGFST